MIEKRRKNHTKFCTIINDFKHLFYPIKDVPGNSSFCLPFVCKSRTIMLQLKEIFKSSDIEYRPIVSGNLLNQPFLQNYKLSGAKSKGSFNVDILHNNGVYIGNNHFLKDNNFVKLILTLKEYHGSRKVRRSNKNTSRKNIKKVRRVNGTPRPRVYRNG